MNNFFGSKLNTVLLLILIVLMVFAIRLMLQNKELYLHPLSQKQENQEQVKTDTSDLVSFSISPGSKIHGVMAYQGIIKGGYFFEGNILINVLDINEKLIKAGYAMATGEWTTAGPVAFEGSIDLTGLPKGSAYIQIHNDNPSGLSEYDKFVLVPIVIE